MRVTSFLICAILLMGGYSAVAASTATSKVRRTTTSNISSLLCLIVETHEMQESGIVEYLECELIQKSDIVHGLRIDGIIPAELVQTHRAELLRGEWFVEISGATIQESYVDGHGMIPSAIVPANREPYDDELSPNVAVVTIPPEQGRHYVRAIEDQQQAVHAQESTKTEPNTLVGDDRNLQKSGKRTVMVVRVSTSDSSPTFTASQLEKYYFDTTSFSFVRQYQWCSFGALQFVPYDASHPVLDVLVPGNAANFTNAQLWPLALAVGAAQKNVSQLTSLAQHIAFVLPPGLGGNAFFAVGTVGFWRSLYYDTWGGYPNFAMHEIGHNLGMGHAGVGTDPYADSSDIMGYGDYDQFGISKCFNGYHLWFLQWFATKSIEITSPSTTPTYVTLAAFADYNATTTVLDQYVVIKVDVYYLVYNRAKGINAGVNDAIDMVTIVQGQPGQFSLRVAVLDNTTAPFQVANFGGGSLPLTFQVCSKTKGKTLDYAVVSIGLGGASNCNNSGGNTAPTAIGTTTAPTLAPTYKATPQPSTLAPTKFPTLAPTLLPTAKPTTKKPTFKPNTKRPTRRPTYAPIAVRNRPI